MSNEISGNTKVVDEMTPVQKALYSRYAGKACKLDGNDAVILKQVDKFAVITDGNDSRAYSWIAVRDGFNNNGGEFGKPAMAE